MGVLQVIRPGELNERITIQQATESRNALGEMVPTWGSFAVRWAKVEGVSAREYLAGGQMDISITHKVRMRFLAGLNQKMRILYRGRTLEIISLLEHDNRTVHELICQEAV
jgi:SPP1 family predicted phage head-tail adaptor